MNWQDYLKECDYLPDFAQIYSYEKALVAFAAWMAAKNSCRELTIQEVEGIRNGEKAAGEVIDGIHNGAHSISHVDQGEVYGAFLADCEFTRNLWTKPDSRHLDRRAEMNKVTLLEAMGEGGEFYWTTFDGLLRLSHEQPKVPEFFAGRWGRNDCVELDSASGAVADEIKGYGFTVVRKGDSGSLGKPKKKHQPKSSGKSEIDPSRVFGAKRGLEILKDSLKDPDLGDGEAAVIQEKIKSLSAFLSSNGAKKALVHVEASRKRQEKINGVLRTRAEYAGTYDDVMNFNIREGDHAPAVPPKKGEKDSKALERKAAQALGLKEGRDKFYGGHGKKVNRERPPGFSKQVVDEMVMGISDGELPKIDGVPSRRRLRVPDNPESVEFPGMHCTIKTLGKKMGEVKDGLYFTRNAEGIGGGDKKHGLRGFVIRKKGGVLSVVFDDFKKGRQEIEFEDFVKGDAGLQLDLDHVFLVEQYGTVRAKP
ncbi:hypothetical protein OTB20_41395 [Streptomyces sp. H27-H1]|uniref:hypothetical protein n=1 Tax=Streptomyces sp. H27-H1 TaxID=2996461 RepID=UPI0022706234|nr:hypothetical protein [Streptomyces sp. H27-H1]MCY0932483.1 hypothetical protein [Streptomyces sp. H27-H1]